MNPVFVLLRQTYRSFFVRRSVYIYLGLAGFLLLVSLPQFMIFSALTETEDPTAILSQRAALIGQMLSFWGALVLIGSLFFGAVQYRHEIKSKTILSTLAKPVSRLHFFAGKFLGTFTFLFSVLIAGYLLAFIFFFYFGITPGPSFWIGFIYEIVRLFAFTGIAYSLGYLLKPVYAGGIGFLLYVLPPIVENLMELGHPVISSVSTFLYYLCPARMPDNLLQAGLQDTLVDPNTWLYFGVIAENLGYGLIILVIGLIYFRQKDIVFSSD